VHPEIARARAALGLGAFLETKKLEQAPIEFENRNARRIGELIQGKTLQLWPKQADALATAFEYEGLFGPIGVGHGKTFISLLLPKVMDSDRAVLFVPPKLCVQLMEADWPTCVYEFAPGYEIHCLNGLTPTKREQMLKTQWTGLMVCPYSLLSTPDADDMLEMMDDVDLIIADECHYLRNEKSARTKRFHRYLQWQDARFCCMSGTITQKSIKDYKHLMDMALGARSPLPNSWVVLNQWDELLRPDTEGQFGMLWNDRGEEVQGLVDWAQKNELFPYQAVAQEHFRKIYSLRLHSCPGVVATSGSSVDCALRVETELFKSIPADMQQHIDNLVDRWTTPDGDYVTDALEYGRYLNQLVNGFYYECFFPPDTPDHVLEKAERHSAFKKAAKKFLDRRKERDFDTPFLLLEGLRKRAPEVARLQHIYDAAYHDGEEPKKDRREVWLSNWKLEQAEKYINDIGPEQGAIIWYQWNLFGEKMYEHLWHLFGDRVVHCPADCDPNWFHPHNYLDSRDQGRILVCAGRAHGTGKNLQHFSNMLFSEWTSNASVFEQYIGRCHRAGQNADEVRVVLSCATGPERQRLLKVLSQARYMEESGAGAQKLLFADYDNSIFAKIARNAKAGLDSVGIKTIMST